MRFLPLLLVPVIAAGALRRDPGAPKSTDRRGQAPQKEAFSIVEKGEVVATKPGATTITIAPRPDGEERERQLLQRVASLETHLRETTETLDQTRAALAKLLNHRGPDPVNFLTEALLSSHERVMELEAQLEILESAHVERVARLRRSD